MTISYGWNKNEIDIQMIDNGGTDIDIYIRIIEPKKNEGMNAISDYFENNTVLTDVFIFAYENHEYKIVVRKDFYVNFMVELFKNQLIEKLEWV